MLTAANLEALSLACLADAEALPRSRRFDGAAYLCGYVVELAFKARICRTLKWPVFPEKRSEFEGLQSFKTHDLVLFLRQPSGIPGARYDRGSPESRSSGDREPVSVMLVGHMNNTKWDEVRLAMHGLGDLSPKWRTLDQKSGYLSEWDGDWYHHFRIGGYESIEWVEIATRNPEQHEAVRAALREVHVPGEETPTGFRVCGFAESGRVLEYL